MSKPSTPSGFPLPSSLKVVPGTERAQAAYPYTMQFGEADDNRFWFYNSMHFPGAHVRIRHGDRGGCVLRARSVEHART